MNSSTLTTSAPHGTTDGELERTTDAATTGADRSNAGGVSYTPAQESGRELQNSIPWSSVGYLTFKRTYARALPKPDSPDATEELQETVGRVIRACREQLDCGFSEAEEERLRRYHLSLKGSVAGRFLWQLGTGTVSKLGLASLQNCAFTVVDTPDAFTWAFDLLMLGSGVGYNIQREHVYKLPAVSEHFIEPVRFDSPSADFIVPDTREGWVELLDRVLRLAFKKSISVPLRYSVHCVRGKGSPIRGFGGVASGPEDLCRGIGQIAAVLSDRKGKQLRPIDCLDIMNIIGQIVVSGNVRRSAQIAIGDADDRQFLSAKRWDLGGIPSWRAMSNNSVVCNDFSLLPPEFWDGYNGNGEPYGLINLKLARSCGRIGDTRYKDKRIQGFNPCAEQGLEPYETCCLAETFLPNITSKEELSDLCTLLYRVCKHSLRLPCHLPETQEVVWKNARMGIGVSGYLQATEEQRGWLKEVYEELRKFDEVYSRARGWPTSIKLTTVKPSGTLSLLPGVTSGCHPAYARYLYRRIRIASDSPLVDTCRSHGYPVEFQRNYDGSEDRGTVVVSFPFSYPEGTVLAKDMTAVDQLEVVKRLQTEWSDNAVSCTVYYKKEELPEIREYLSKNYNKNFKTLSFLLHSEHGFDQAPLEEITKEQYDELVSKVVPITSIAAEVLFASDDECASGVCPIK